MAKKQEMKSMAAKNLSQVRTGLREGAHAALLVDRFAEAYFGQAFGVLSKAEIDLLMFRVLIETKIIDPEGSIFSMARALNVTPGKAKNLLFQYQLRYMDETAADAAVLNSLAKARFSVDESRLSFGIESPLARATIQSRLQELGVFPEISLSGDILKVPLEHFATFITILLGPEKAGELETKLKKAGHLKDSSLKTALSRYGKAAGKGAAGAAGKEGFTRVFSGLGDWLSGGGVEAIGDVLSGMVTG